MKIKAQHARRLVVMFLALMAAACNSIPSDTIVQSSSLGKTEPSENDLIKGYREWTRVNPVPADLHAQNATLCVALTPEQSKREAGNPHRDKFITVYVNDAGTKAMMHEKNPRFPKDSVIVKEKLPSKDSSSPELLTVMIKRQAGYNPDNGDWEYMAFDGTGKEVQARGRLENCQACHTTVKDNDYVYRSYLPYEIWKKLN